MPKLWVFGDSFSSKDNRIVVDYIDWKGYVPKVFSDLLSNKLNISSINMGINGADNYTIIDTVIDSLNRINSNDIIIIGWSSTTRFRIASKKGNFLTIRPNSLSNDELNDIIYMTDICVDCLNEIVVNRNNQIYIDEINRYIRLIDQMYPNNVIINWSPFKQETEGMFVTPITQKIETIFDETNGEISDKHFSEHGHEQMSNYLYDLIKNYNNNKKVKFL